ncbi:Sec1-like protein [Fimicolochytrium jonesii]|uniref:Sec1-like protein n=1 Tax=Fimicolochytrium jonesii TaxID=1396493 RepID=UPI0022FE2CE4|nr:Sec1-like protein [Fimicolochytrium jonesii]KAI8817099.1 Sec1-like protein [Fimicolochytrium jonesii]
MDVIKAVQNYLNRMITEVTGMKVLLMDAETTAIISMVMTQTQLLQREVYLIDRIDNRQREKMKHLKCIAFVRSTGESVQALVEELRDPRYGDYYLYFSNTLRKSDIERLAEVDEHEVVREVQEYFADFLSINADLFHLNLQAPMNPMFTENLSTWDTKTFQRTTEGILAMLLALKKKPLIRYEKSSSHAKKLAGELAYQMQQEGPLFDFRRPDTAPILLIMDRRNDPVTPLLLQWTYQAMVHELIGITNGRVDLSSVPDIRPEMKEVVLNPDQDSFYRKNMYLNMGDLGGNIKSYVDEYQTKHKSSAQVNSITDMKKFVEDYPEFRKLSGNVTKHVTLVGELSRQVGRGHLMEVGELEQSLAVNDNHTQDLKQLKALVERTDIPDDARVRLVLLYALRYEKSQANATPQLLDILARSGVSDKKIALVGHMIQYAGSDHRLEDLFSNQNVFSRTKNVFKGLQGVENVYTQHSPHMVEVLQECIKGKLKDQLYPFVEGVSRDKPQDIIVFMIGGTTYSEAYEVNKLNAANPGVRIVLGGTTVHSSGSFLREVADSVTRWSGSGKSHAPASSPPQDRLRSARI